MDAGRPLHYKEITQLILEQWLWKTSGRTPERTVNAQLATFILASGNNSEYQRISPGVFSYIGNSDFETVTPVALLRESKTFTDAAEEVLTHFADQKPMHYQEITRQAMEQGILSSSGRTPGATMYAQIIQEEQRRKQRAEIPRFERFGNGMVGLTSWRPVAVGLEREIEAHNKKIREQVLETIKKLTSTEFEELVGKLLIAMGFENVEVTRASGDGGIDVRGTLVVGDAIHIKMAVQVKKWRNNVQAPDIQRVRGSLNADEKGLIITTSKFASGAKREASEPTKVPINLMDGPQLVTILIEHGIMVEKKSLEFLVLS